MIQMFLITNKKDNSCVRIGYYKGYYVYRVYRNEDRVYKEHLCRYVDEALDLLIKLGDKKCQQIH